MNFLAHIYLSGQNEEVAIGNFIGDFVKGNQLERYPVQMQRGILLHRHIDEYTDSHPLVMQSKTRLREKYRHYAPVIVDIYYDHFLASLWSDYHSTTLKKFTEDFYKIVQTRHQTLPEKAKRTYHFMQMDNWLYHYQFVDGIRQALTGMSRRTTFESRMEYAADDLLLHYEEFKHEFQQFFPELEAAANTKLLTI